MLFSDDSIFFPWLFVLRMACRSFAESFYIYSLFNVKGDCLNKWQHFGFVLGKNPLVFTFAYSFISVLLVVFCNTAELYRLVLVALVFFCFWLRQKQLYRKLVSNYNNTQGLRYILTVAVILILVVDSFNSMSHVLLHMFFVSIGIYDVIRTNAIQYELYKFAIMFLELLFIFWAHKAKFIRMKDIRSISVNKGVFLLFSFCLLSLIYIGYTYDNMPPLIAPYRNSLLCTMAFILPTYWSFYLIINHQTKLLNLRSNTTLNADIVAWIFNPSALEMTSLRVYDSDIFISNFESKKFILKEKLGKLGINDECKGYSELILCLFLTRLLIGLKDWSFEREIYEQAALIVDIPVLELRTNIDGIINRVWSTSEPKTLVDGYYYPYCKNKTYDQTHRPTVDEFLMRIAGSI